MPSSRSRRLAFVSLAFVSLVALSCKRPEPTAPKRRAPAEAIAQEDTATISEPARRTTLVARVPMGTFGPRLASGAGGHLTVWATTDGDAPGWYAAHVPEGERGEAPRLLGPVQSGLEFFELSAMGPGASSGVAFTTASVRRAGESRVIEVRVLGGDGALVSGPHVAAETAETVPWMTLVPVSGGGLLLWAEQRGPDADLFALRVGAAGVEGARRRVASGALAWQAVESADGAWLVAVLAPGERARVVAARLGPDAKALGPDVEVAANVSGARDLDAALRGGDLIVAFGHSAERATRLERVIVDATGRVTGARRPLTLPRRDQTLVRLLADRNGAYALWEEPNGAARDVRRVLVSRLDQAGLAAGPEAELVVAGTDPLLPAAVLGPEGLVLLTEAPSCRAGAEAARTVASGASASLHCSSSSPLARLFTVTRDLARPNNAERLVLEQLGHLPAAMAWDPECSEHGCAVLLAGGDEPTAVFLARLAAPSGNVSPLVPVDKSLVPRVVTAQAITVVPELADSSVKVTSRGPLVGWLGYFDPGLSTGGKPAPDGRKDPVAAELELALYDAPTAPDVEVSRLTSSSISLRARSEGGIAVSDEQGGRRLVAWVALDQRVPQVFLTLVDSSGKKLKQRMLTRSPGDKTDVSVVALDKGYLVAWVDARDGTPEVFAALVDEQTGGDGPQVRLTRGAEDPTGVTLGRIGQKVLVAWADARGASRPGRADVFVEVLEPPRLGEASEPRRIAASDAHSHSPVLTPLEGGSLMLSYIDAVPSPLGPEPSSLVFVELDGDARIVSSPARLAFEDEAKAHGIECRGGTCRVAVLADDGRDTRVVLGEWRGGETHSREVHRIFERDAQSVPPQVASDAVYLFSSRESAAGASGAGGRRWVLERLGVVWQ